MAAARTALRENRVAVRTQLVHLVSLASRHFPELLGDPDVQRFMGSDGLIGIGGRCLADYDDRRPLSQGRNELQRATCAGMEVCLKVFPVQGDMRAYEREVVRVQQLRHPYIIRYSNVFEEEGRIYLEMEYFEAWFIAAVVAGSIAHRRPKARRAATDIAGYCMSAQPRGRSQ